MQRSMLFPLAMVVLLTGLLAAAPHRQAVATGAAPEDVLIRQGNTAFQRGDLGQAIAFYEKAEEITTDPGQAAFNLAVARYCLAQMKKTGEKANELREAEVLFRSCKDTKDPRQARALYGLGLCLLDNGSRKEELNRAFDYFDVCVRLAAEDEQLAAAARQGRELARLRLVQVLGQPMPDNEEPPNQEKPPRGSTPEQKPQPSQQGDRTQQGVEHGNTRTENVRVKQEPGSVPQATNDQPPPGSSTSLPPVPDRADLPPMSPRDAAEHLDQASRRILDEARFHRLRKARPSPQGVRDW